MQAIRAQPEWWRRRMRPGGAQRRLGGGVLGGASAGEGRSIHDEQSEDALTAKYVICMIDHVSSRDLLEDHGPMAHQLGSCRSRRSVLGACWGPMTGRSFRATTMLSGRSHVIQRARCYRTHAVLCGAHVHNKLGFVDMRILIGALLSSIACASFGANHVSLADFREALRPFGEGQAVETRCEEFFSTANELTGLTLIVGAAHCFREQKLVESAFLISVGDVRLAAEVKYFDPLPENMSLFNVAWWLRTQFMSPYGRDVVFRDAQMVSRLFTLFDAWRPNLAKNTSPGWNFAINPRIDIGSALATLRLAQKADLTLYAKMIQDDDLYRAKLEYEAFSTENNHQFTAGTQAAKKHDELLSALQSHTERVKNAASAEAGTTPNPATGTSPSVKSSTLTFSV